MLYLQGDGLQRQLLCFQFIGPCHGQRWCKTQIPGITTWPSSGLAMAHMAAISKYCYYCALPLTALNGWATALAKGYHAFRPCGPRSLLGYSCLGDCCRTFFAKVRQLLVVLALELPNCAAAIFIQPVDRLKTIHIPMVTNASNVGFATKCSIEGKMLCRVALIIAPHRLDFCVGTPALVHLHNISAIVHNLPYNLLHLPWRRF